jgi:hypothetical protein
MLQRKEVGKEFDIFQLVNMQEVGKPCICPPPFGHLEKVKIGRVEGNT